MYALLTKLLVSGNIKFELGRITMFGDPVAIVPMVSLKNMTSDAVKGGKQAIQDLYLEGWVYGFKMVNDMAKRLKLNTFEEKYRVSMDIISLIGFGDYQTVSYEAGNAYWKVLKNPFALLYYPSKEKVDHYLRGVNAGGGTIVQNNIMYCIEEKCAAENGKFCLQANLDEKHLSVAKQNIVKEQLDLEYLKPRQIQIIRQCGEKPEKYGINKEDIKKADELIKATSTQQ